MNALMKPSQLLENATALIERAAGQLDSRGHTCESCGAYRYENFEQAKLLRRMQQHAESLVEMAALLARDGK